MQSEVAGRTGPDGQLVRLRAGIHAGPFVGGVISSKKFAYDLWGDAVNAASRMERAACQPACRSRPKPTRASARRMHSTNAE